MRRLSFLLLAALAGCHRDSDDDPLPPAAPTGLTATPVDSGQVDLAWTDASGNELEFVVELSRDSATWVEMARLPADSVAYSALGLAPATAYSFRVRASGYGGPSGAATSTAATPNATWTGPATPTGPGARWGHSAVVAGTQLIVFGGNLGPPMNDVWSFDLAGAGGWTDITPLTGPAPSGRVNPSVVHDPDNDRIVVFGGDANALANEVWALNLSGTPLWSKLLDGIAIPAPPLPPPAPSPRFSHSAVYDSVNKRMIVFGGNDGLQILDDLWAFSLSATPSWTLLTPAGAPEPREEHTAIYDPVGLRMIVFAGNDNSIVGDGSIYSNGAWALDLPLGGAASWSQLAPAGAAPTPPREKHSAVYDDIHRRMVVFGGIDDMGNLLADVWVLGLGAELAWSPVIPGGAAIGGRVEHAAGYDSIGNRMVVVGGDDDTFTGFDEQWMLGF